MAIVSQGTAAGALLPLTAQPSAAVSLEQPGGLQPRSPPALHPFWGRHSHRPLHPALLHLLCLAAAAAASLHAPAVMLQRQEQCALHRAPTCAPPLPPALIAPARPPGGAAALGVWAALRSGELSVCASKPVRKVLPFL